MPITKMAEKLIRVASGGAYSANAREVKKHVLWDTRYFDATATSRTLFSVPVGGSWMGGTTKSKNETNLEESGRLPTNQEMVFTHMAPHFCIHYPDKETQDLADIVSGCQTILESSYFVMQIRNKADEIFVHGSEFLPRPIFLAGMQDNNTDAEDVFSVGNAVHFGWLNLDPVPVPLGDGQGFTVEHVVTNADAAVLTALDNAASRLNSNKVTMQVLLAGVTTHGK
jgi:hypothetical protein